jgi:hypothetical protein
MQKVTSIEHLKQLAYRENGEYVQFYIFLAGGIARSGKMISYRPKETKNWLIINEIDDSYQELLDKNLAKRTSIVAAIENGAFFYADIS